MLSVVAGLRLLAIAFSLGVSILLARLLNPAGYGQYAFAISLLGLLIIPFQVGVPSMIAINTAEHVQRKEPGILKAFMLRTIGGMLVFGVIVSVLILLVAATATSRNESIKSELLVSVAFAAPAMAVTAALCAYLRGLDLQVASVATEIFARPFSLLLMIIMLWRIEFKFSPFLATTAYLCSVLIAFGMAVYLSTKTPEAKAKANFRFPQPLLKKALPFFLVGGVVVVMKFVDVVMMGFLAVDPGDIGVYRLAAQLSAFFLIGTSILAPVLEPRARAFVVRGEKRELVITLKKYAVMPFLVFLTGYGICLLFGEVLFSFVFGVSYVEANKFVLILGLSYAFDVMLGFTAILMLVTDRAQQVAKIGLIAVAANILLNLSLIPFFGATGAASATAFSWALYKLLLALLVRTEDGAWLIPSFRAQSLSR